MKISFVSLMSFCVLIACQSLIPAQRELSPEQKTLLESELQAAWDLLQKSQFDQALGEFRLFQKQRSPSPYDVEARLGEARALDGLGEFSISQTLYREILVERIHSHPAWAVRAQYYLSFPLEGLGNETEMLATLLDAEKGAQHLPDLIAWVQLPLRLSLVYGRLGQMGEANRYQERADQGVTKLRAQGLSPQDWAALSYELGSQTMNLSTSPEFRLQAFENLKKRQMYLYRALESGVAPWAELAFTHLSKSYRNLYSLSLNPVVNQALDKGAQERLKVEQIERSLVDLLELFDLLPAENQISDLKPSPLILQWQEFARDSRKTIQAQLASLPNRLMLTPESKKRRSTK